MTSARDSGQIKAQCCHLNKRAMEDRHAHAHTHIYIQAGKLYVLGLAALARDGSEDAHILADAAHAHVIIIRSLRMT